MKCDYCGSIFQKLPEEGVCPNCGGIFPTAEERKAKLKFPDPPLGIYKDAAGYLEIGPESVTFFRKHFIKAYIRTIPYEYIFSVSFKREDPFQSGFICVREWQDRNIPMGKEAVDVVLDDTSVYFREKGDAKFEKVYLFLSKCAELVRQNCNQGLYAVNEIPYGKYIGSYGFLDMGKDAVTIYKKCPLQESTSRVIPYSEIAEVRYAEALGNEGGALCIRGQNEAKSLRETLQVASIDDASIDFDKNANDVMRNVYRFLVNKIHENCNHG